MEANDMAAMREALEFVAHMCDSPYTTYDVLVAVKKARAALSAPPRNCDVGTAEEQSNRMRKFCAKQKMDGIINCGYCPIKHQYQRDCTLAWAQMPYEAEEGDSK